VTVIADGAKWIWAQAAACLPGAAGVLDFYHASERLYQAGRELLGETPAAVAWAEARRGTLLGSGGAALLAELAAAGPAAAGADGDALRRHLQRPLGDLLGHSRLITRIRYCTPGGRVGVR
jgi:hypothetical protein